MSVIEVHPEELLDREREGILSASERALLDAHLQRCAACRLERKLRDDFSDEARLMPLTTSDLSGVISGALRAAERPEPGAQSISDEAPRGTSRSARRVAALLVASALLSLGVGYAGAQLGIAERGITALFEQAGLTAAKKRPARRAPRAAEPKRVQSEKVAVAVPEARAMDVAPVAERVSDQPGMRVPRPRARALKRPVHLRSLRAPQPISSAVASPIHAASAGATSFSASAPAASSVGPVTGTPAASADALAAPERPAPVLSESAGTLFERANRARHRGATTEAAALYAELRSRYPESAEARLSQAVVARMQLDRGEYRAAVAGFEAYLASSDRALHEEAMVGRVRALMQLGKLDDAAEAAETLLRAHPRTAFAKDAEALIERAERD